MTRAQRPLPAVRLTLLALVAALLAAPAHAQDRSVDAVLAALEASAAAIVDLEFVLEGELIDEAGQTFRLEVEVLAIPSEPAIGLYILQPDAIADNQIVVVGDEVRNYTFLTNQVSLFDTSDPDAFGGLIEPSADGSLPLSLDLAAVFAGWDATIEADDGDTVTVRFVNRDPAAAMQTVLATVTTDTWDPVRLVFLRAGDALFADLRFVDWTRDQGLTLEDVTYLPEDAEVLDRRRR
jgi:outer membrane lipoprotein-sorting protein